MRKYLILLAVSLSACQLQGQLADLSNGLAGQASTSENRLGNPARKPFTPAESGPALTIGTDVDQDFKEANVACQGSQLSAYLRFKKVEGNSRAEIKMTCKNRSETLAFYQISDNTDLFDFVVLEPRMLDMVAKSNCTGNDFQIRVTQKRMPPASADAGLSFREETVFEAQANLALSEPAFTFAPSVQTASRMVSVKLNSLKVTARIPPSFDSAYACWVSPERRLALRLQGVTRAAPSLEVTRFVPVRQRKLYVSSKEDSLSFEMSERDLETMQGVRGALVQHGEAKGSKPLMESTSFSLASSGQ